MANPVVVACPRCHQSDAVRKVSSIVAEGASEVNIERLPPLAWPTHISRDTRQPSLSPAELLAQRLTPPSSQEIFTFVRYRYRTPLPKVILLMILGLLVLLSVGSALFWPGSLAAFLFGTLLVLTLCAISLYGIVYVARRRSRYDLEVVTLREKVQTNWAKLYYCARDDIVFNPDTARWAAVSQMRELLV